MAVTFKEEDVAPLRILVMKEKATVMDPVMEVAMMVIMDVREILYAEATIARNLEYSTMKKTIAVKNLLQLRLNSQKLF